MSITIRRTQRGTQIQATGADALAFFSRMAQPIDSRTHKIACLSAFDDLTAADRRARLNTSANVRTAARAAL